MFTPSPQQVALYDWVANGTGSATVVSVAGSGKTTSLLGLLTRTTGTVAIMAFNKAIAVEIEAKLHEAVAKAERFLRATDDASKTATTAEAAEAYATVGLANRVKVGTVHSFGNSALWRAFGKLKIDVRARADAVDATLRPMAMSLIRDAISDSKVEVEIDAPSMIKELLALVRKVMGYAKQRGFGVLIPYASTEGWLDLWEHFSLDEDLPDDGVTSTEMVIALARAGLEWSAKNVGPIDFDDMIWLPLVRRLRPTQYDWVLVDEAQDTNPARRALARTILRPRGRAVFVGDPRQAIYGFTGADGDALDLIRRDFNAIELPLTVSWRCPKTVVAHARQWVEHIEAAPSAPEGVVRFLPHETGPGVSWIESERQAGMLTADDAILCRNTKPLVELAYRLIRRGIACHVEGREIGAGLLKLVDKWKVRTIDALRDRLETWADKQVAALTAKGNEAAAGGIVDRVETLYVLMDGCRTVDELREKIRKLFDDTPEGGKARNLTLSTIHKSKGREWDRVYWLGRSTLQPSKYARQAWEEEQEVNLMYVAATRAKAELVEVELPPKPPGA